MSQKKDDQARGLGAGNVVHGTAIGSVVGDKGKVDIKSLEVVQGNRLQIVYGDGTRSEIDSENPLFASYEKVSERETGGQDLLVELEGIRQEAKKGDSAEPGFLRQRLLNLAKMAPEIFDITVATLASPAAGFALIVRKIAQKAKEEAKQQTDSTS